MPDESLNYVPHSGYPLIVLQRFGYTPLGTFGSFDCKGVTLYTVERPWLENRPTISCIPEGDYHCQPRQYFRGGYPAVEITNVPGRSHILFHKGNTMSDLAGCIAVTSSLGCVKGTWGGLNSKPAFDLFMTEYGFAPFELRVVGPAAARLG